MFTIGLVGAGYWGSNYLRVFEEMPNVDLAWCADLDKNRLNDVKERYPDIETTTDYTDLYDDLDGVCIATPPQTHREIAANFLKRDIGVLVEKPLALSISDATEIANLAEKSSVPVLVGHIFEFHPAVRDLRNYVEDGSLGNIDYIHSQRTGLGPIRQDVSALWDLCPHDVSIFTYLLEGEPVSVRCIGHSFLQDIEDAVYLFVKFDDGTETIVHASWLHPKKTRQVTVVGDEQMAIFDDTDPDQLLQIFEKTVDIDQPQGLDEFQFTTREGDVHLPFVEHREPLKIQAEHFVECIKTGDTPLTDAEDGLTVVKVLAAAQQSLEEGGTVVRL